MRLLQRSMPARATWRSVAVGLAAILWLVASPGPALADKYADCNQSTDLQRRIAGCTAVIEDRGESRRKRAFAYNNRGTAYSDLKQYRRAIKNYDAAIRLKPDDAIAYFNRGIVYGRLKQYRRAIKDYDAAITLKPDNASFYVNHAKTYLILGEPAKGLASADHALKLKPNSALAYNTRGFIHRVMGNRAAAISDFSRAVSLTTDGSPVYVSASAALRKLGAPVPKAGGGKPATVVAGRWDWVARCSLTGKWTGDLVLTGNAAAFSGFLRSDQSGGDGRITDGRVVGNQISFKRHVTWLLGRMVHQWKGTISGNKFSGKVVSGTPESCTFSAKLGT